MGVFTKKADAKTARALPYSAHRPLTAAAQRLNVSDKNEIEKVNKRRSASAWQDDAWEYYDLIGEIKYAFRLFSNVLSRVHLYVGVVEDEGDHPVPIDQSSLSDATKAAAKKAMKRVLTSSNQTEILRKASINLLVAGECYLVQLPPKHGIRDREQWKIVSVDELITRGKSYKIRSSRTQREQDMEEITNTFVGRIWNEHPRYSDEADSSMRALVDLCDELFLFSRAARASARSRLNAGALFVPDDLSVSADQTDAVDDPAVGDPTETLETDEFEQELLDAMTTPISDESSAASVVPLLIRGPAEAGQAIRHIKFERSFDPQIAQRAERALERILQGIDLPKDIVTGLANIKYSNAVQIEESLYTAHIEPYVLMICDAFRLVYLEPALQAAQVPLDESERVVIWYDPSAIMTAPDKSNAANVGFDKMALSWEAWRRANGFPDTDAPTPEEIAQRIAVMRGQLSPEITEALFKTLIPDVLAAVRQQSLAESPAALSEDVQQMLDNGLQPPDINTEGSGGTSAQPPPIVDETGSGNDSAQPPPPVPGS